MGRGGGGGRGARGGGAAETAAASRGRPGKGGDPRRAGSGASLAERSKVYETTLRAGGYSVLVELDRTTGRHRRVARPDIYRRDRAEALRDMMLRQELFVRGTAAGAGPPVLAPDPLHASSPAPAPARGWGQGGNNRGGALSSNRGKGAAAAASRRPGSPSPAPPRRRPLSAPVGTRGGRGSGAPGQGPCGGGGSGAPGGPPASDCKKRGAPGGGARRNRPQSAPVGSRAGSAARGGMGEGWRRHHFYTGGLRAPAAQQRPALAPENEELLRKMAQTCSFVCQ